MTIRVLIVEDSMLVSEVIAEIFNDDHELQVVGQASDGPQAVRLAERLGPDIITLDMHLPGMSGLKVIAHIMEACPTPILVLTSDPSEALRREALRLGALEVLEKPEGIFEDSNAQASLIEAIKLLAPIPVVRHAGKRIDERLDRLPNVRLPTPDKKQRPPSRLSGVGVPAVGLVASSGGPEALSALLSALPESFPAALLLVQHLTTGFVGNFAEWLRRSCTLNIHVAHHDDVLRAGELWIAPDNFHMEVTPLGRVRLSRNSEQFPSSHCPSGDFLLSSVARVYGARGVGVILTGMGADGAEGLRAIANAGGLTIAQDEHSSSVFGMPKAAIDRAAVRHILPLHEIAPYLVHLLTSGDAYA